MKAFYYYLIIKVHQKQNIGLSWNRAMDEVHVERLIQKYKDNGELDSEDPALLILKRWPACEQYKDNPDKLPGLEQQVFTYQSFVGRKPTYFYSTQQVLKLLGSCVLF